ncbi:MAG: nucleotidyl transferase AbiEii/AbiGii toxin family protein [Candidatus Altiarchaeota archaeon]
MDKDILRILSLKTGLGMNYLSKEEKISALLSELSGRLPEEYVLKGGTALNRIYLQKQGVGRFSEDIDLDLVSTQTLDKKIEETRKMMNGVNGFEIGTARLMHRTLRFDCSYQNELGVKDLIRMEFYLSHDKLACAKKPEKTLISSAYAPSKSAFFNTYSLEDLLAGKILALYSRTEGKDVYDVFYGLETDYDRNMLKNALKIQAEFYKIKESPNELLRKTAEKLGTIATKSKYVGNSTNHYIPQKMRPDWSIFIRTLKLKLADLKL